EGRTGGRHRTRCRVEIVCFRFVRDHTIDTIPLKGMHSWLSHFPGRTEGSAVTDYGAFSFEDKQEVLDKAKEFWNPGKTQFWIDSGTPLVIDRREGYLIWDMSGRRLIDAHLNGGTYNVGHRNREVGAAAAEAV